MRGRVNAIRTFKGLVADLRLKKYIWWYNNKRIKLRLKGMEGVSKHPI